MKEYLVKIPASEIVTLDDGFKYYWPEHTNGCFSSRTLRDIADQLDEMNKDWSNQIDMYFNTELDFKA